MTARDTDAANSLYLIEQMRRRSRERKAAEGRCQRCGGSAVVRVRLVDAICGRCHGSGR